MAKQKFEKPIPTVNVGTIGHTHYGKAALSAAISSVLARVYGGSPEEFLEPIDANAEYERGITINSNIDN